jgi:TonB family protein
MWLAWLMTAVVLAGEFAGGQQAGAPAKNATSGAGTGKSSMAGASAGRAAGTGRTAAAPSKPVTIYQPRKPVTAPRLLPPAVPLDFPKNCSRSWSGESELSLLVDTKGKPRNVMFLKPSGTMADRFAIIIVNRDRFAPGTLQGKPVVVAESLDVKMDACLVHERNAAGRMVWLWALKSSPEQKLKKPKNPPQVAELAPQTTPRSELARKVTRPDFFGNGESAPVLLYSDDAAYTPSRPGTKGTCEVSLVVDAHGLLQGVHVLKKLDPGLDRSALWAVGNYRFFPAIKGDKPVPAAVVVSVDFTPPRN